VRWSGSWAWSQQPFVVPGFNALIKTSVEFQVDFLHSSDPSTGSACKLARGLVCPIRSSTTGSGGPCLPSTDYLPRAKLPRVRVYATEQVTPFFAWLRRPEPPGGGE